MDDPRARRIWLLIGIALLATAGVLHLQPARESEALPAADVRLEILAPDGRLLLDVPVHVEEGKSTVLGVLLAASEEHQFTLRLDDAYVRELYGYEAAGACGWVYRVDGAWGDRAAEDYAVRDGARVHWEWRCSEPA